MYNINHIFYNGNFNSTNNKKNAKKILTQSYSEI